MVNDLRLMEKQITKYESLFDAGYFYCPICNRKVLRSEYLQQQFGDTNVGWLANMVTHYRHHHIKSWDRCWGRYGHRYRNGWFGNYDEEKENVNERAKRQIIRKGLAFLKHHQITADTFEILRNTSLGTIILAEKKLGRNKLPMSNENVRLFPNDK